MPSKIPIIMPLGTAIWKLGGDTNIVESLDIDF